MRNYEINKLPELNILNECFNHDRETGILIWKVRPLHHFKNSHGMNSWNARLANKRAGNLTNSNCVCVSIDFVSYLVHRIIWKMYYGEDPKELIDHIDGDRSNNRIENLREATRSQNNKNLTGLKSNNTSGCTGVHFHTRFGKWVARISILGKHKHLGYFDNKEDAIEARIKAAKEQYGEFFK